MDWRIEIVLMIAAQAIYMPSLIGAWGFFYLYANEIRTGAFSRAAGRINKHLRWGKRNEALFIVLMGLCIFLPIVNTYITYCLYRGRNKWPLKKG